MATIAQRLQLVRDRIDRAVSQFGRAPGSVELLAVSKTFDAQAVRQAVQAGQHAFGENYVQEALTKMAELADLRAQLQWHLIGPLQRNKTRVVAEHFDWVHSIESAVIAQRLSEQRPAHLPKLQVCIQVNTSGQASKHGVPAEQAWALAQVVLALPGLRLRGIMGLPEPSSDGPTQSQRLHEVRVVFELLRSKGLPLDTLSLGMSADLEAAIEQGSTLVRVGTALFGAR